MASVANVVAVYAALCAIARCTPRGITLPRRRALDLNAHVERFIQTQQHECLNHFELLGAKHMDHLIEEILEHYHTERPHQSLNNEPQSSPKRLRISHSRDDPVCWRSRLGGLLKHYYRA